MKPNSSTVFTLILLILILAGCISGQTNVSATPRFLPTQTLTPPPPSTPTLMPTAIGGSTGSVIYDDNENIAAVDLGTGDKKIILSRADLETLLPKDRSDESYGGYKTPLKIDLSPDMTKAYTYVCADLDKRSLCIYENFIYDIEEKTVTKLDNPPGENGVTWQWSPDGSKLVGAGWIPKIIGTAVNVVVRESTSFYSINVDGTNLTTLAPVINQNSRFVWRPDGQIVYPLSSLPDFKAIYVDSSEIEDVSIEGLIADDKIDCLAFSPLGQKVSFAINHEAQKDHYWVYTAHADFTKPTLISEFDTDSRYGCEIEWSNDQRFVHLIYDFKYYPLGGVPDPLDFVFNIETQSSVEIPENSNICGWTPDSNLVYEVHAEVKVHNMSTSNEVNLPTAITNCPARWLKEDLPFKLSN